jgi:AraC-like DNA-binding protein
LVVLQAICAWLEGNPTHQVGWLTAARDPEIEQALILIHTRGEEVWSVATLASHVHLSRSTFSERSTRLVGTSPMRYLTRWRMLLASSWIREERMPVIEAAHRLGYSSQAAFSRAFKRQMQTLPGLLRHSASLQAPATAAVADEHHLAEATPALSSAQLRARMTW